MENRVGSFSTLSCGTKGQNLSLLLLSPIYLFIKEEPVISARLLTILLLFSPLVCAANKAMVSVEVIPLAHGVSPGESFEIAVIFSMEPDWHTYWQNPGEAGMPTSFEWNLPENFQLTGQREPTPTRHVDQEITTFIHEEEAIYLFDIQAPDEVADSNHFTVEINWLECKDLCQPGSSGHQFVLLASETPVPDKAEWTTLIERAESRFPRSVQEIKGRLVHKGDHIELALKRSSWAQKLLSADFFPFDEMIYDSGKSIQVKRGLFRDNIIIPLQIDLKITPEVLHGVLVQINASPTGPTTTHSIIHQQLP
ncbi:MAG: hypothetical protein HON27_10725 [Candidatus Marinimicrobia bacterium]|jgi:DsbC/DsbD-like thiol-disulfide interchange protein|nr:hypothetical protein [Candidatus Neomarinimicrobiota bacterium]MBT4360374.1 hypothetical protein [Candidatus Neomarinimicrobiota bacterium]MBT4946630.1 hypothetical protein [Candidatus Neomarinimicrobiota bacterium]MBT5268625.1 hypothetical protein [Candidatus Neomarinimicrobiota bacterium]